MFRPRIIPVMLLRGRGLVKTIKFKSPTYIGDPINAVKLFNDMLADELIFLDITATKENRLPPLELIKDIAEKAFMPFAIGGGITKLDDVKKFIKAGAEKVVINSASVSNPDLIAKSAEIFGNQSVVVSIDVKKNIFGKIRVYIKSGTKSTSLDPIEHAVNMAKLGAGEIMINSIEKDGTMAGMDYQLFNNLASALNVPLIACGGAGSLEHLKLAVVKGNASAVAAGSMFVYQGARRGILINYPERNELIKLFNQ